MQASLTIDDIRRGAGGLTRQRIDDVAARICVERSRVFAGARPVAYYGPLLGRSATAPGEPDPVAAAALIGRHGRQVGLSIEIHLSMPALGDRQEVVDVAELRRDDSSQHYWFAASPDWAGEGTGEAPVLLADQHGVSDVVVSAAALRDAFSASVRMRRLSTSQCFRDFLALDRDRHLAQAYPPPALAAMARRQSLIAEATSSAQARRLTARGAAPLVPLRVTLDDLLGEAEGPVAKAVADYEWTVRQPLDGGVDRITGYAAGRQGIALLARTFGTKATRLLCLDADRLEFDVARTAGSQRARPIQSAATDPIALALDESNTRETGIVARQISARVIARTPPSSGSCALRGALTTRVRPELPRGRARSGYGSPMVDAARRAAKPGSFCPHGRQKTRGGGKQRFGRSRLERGCAGARGVEDGQRPPMAAHPARCRPRTPTRDPAAPCPTIGQGGSRSSPAGRLERPRETRPLKNYSCTLKRSLDYQAGMIWRSWMDGASIEATLELCASGLREVTTRLRPLFRQERVAASAGLLLDGLLGNERRKTGWMRAEAAGDPGPWRQQAMLGLPIGTPTRCTMSFGTILSSILPLMMLFR